MRRIKTEDKVTRRNVSQTGTSWASRRKGDSAHLHLHRVTGPMCTRRTQIGDRRDKQNEGFFVWSEGTIAPTKQKGLVGWMFQTLDTKDRRHGVLGWGGVRGEQSGDCLINNLINRDSEAQPQGYPLRRFLDSARDRAGPWQ